MTMIIGLALTWSLRLFHAVVHNYFLGVMHAVFAFA